MRNPTLAYSISEFGKATSLGRTTIYAAIAAGELKALKVGRRTIIPADEAATWLESLCRSGGDPRDA